MVRALFWSKYSTMFGKNYQIYNVHITGKYILWISFLLILIISPCRTIPLKICPHIKSIFFEKRPSSLHHKRVLQNKTESKKELVETQIYMKDNFLVRYCITVHFWREVSFEQHNEFQVSLSLWFQFSESVAKIYFRQIYNDGIP